MVVQAHPCYPESYVMRYYEETKEEVYPNPDIRVELDEGWDDDNCIITVYVYYKDVLVSKQSTRVQS